MCKSVSSLVHRSVAANSYMGTPNPLSISINNKRGGEGDARGTPRQISAVNLAYKNTSALQRERRTGLSVLPTMMDQKELYTIGKTSPRMNVKDKSLKARHVAKTLLSKLYRKAK